MRIRRDLDRRGVDRDVVGEALAEHAPSTVGGLRVIPSPYGHDGFLVERDRVFDLVGETLALALANA